MGYDVNEILLLKLTTIKIEFLEKLEYLLIFNLRMTQLSAYVASKEKFTISSKKKKERRKDDYIVRLQMKCQTGEKKKK